MMDIGLLFDGQSSQNNVALIPVMVGPLTTLFAMLPAILVAVGGVIVSLLKPTAIKRLLMMMWAQKLIVIPIILLITGTVWGVGHIMKPGLEEVAEAETGSMEWPVFRGTPNRLGYVPGEIEDPAHGRMQWSFTDGAVNTFYSSPSLMGNRIYITSADVPNNRGAILSIDADTGKLVWAYRGDDSPYRATFSSPSISGRYLVVGEGLHYTKDARVFCLDVVESEKQRRGVKLWEYRTGCHVESSPLIANGRVYVGAGDDGTYCFDLEPDEKGNARKIWQLTGGNYSDCETSPVYHDGRVYFGLGLHKKETGSGGQAVVCVDAATGEEYWRVATPFPVFSSPSISDGKLYFGMGNGDFIFRAEVLAQNIGLEMGRQGASQAEIDAAIRAYPLHGEVWCVDLETQTVDWKFRAGRTVLGSIAVEGDRVFFGSRDGNLYMLSTEGKLLRTVNVHSPIISSPSVGTDLVYVATTTGQLYGVDKERLEQVWHVSLDSQTFSSPAVGRGHLFIGTVRNGVMSMGQPGRIAMPPIWSGALGGAERGGNIDGSVLPLRAIEAWAYNQSENSEDEENKPQFTSPMAQIEDQFYVGYTQGAVHGLLGLEASQDEQSPGPKRSWLASSTNTVSISAAATADGVYFVDGKPGDAARALRRVDPQTGAERWQHAVADEAGGQFSITYDHLFIADLENGLSCIDLAASADKPKVLWQATLGKVQGEIFIHGDYILVSLADKDQALVLDAGTGLPVWQQNLSAAAGTGPVLIDDRVWVGQKDGLAGYPLVDRYARRVLRADDAGALAGRLIIEDDYIISTNEAGELVVVQVVHEQPDMAVVDAPASGSDDAVAGGPKAGLVAATAEDVPQAATLAPSIKLNVNRVKGLKAGSLPLVTRSGLLYLTEGMIQRYDFTTGRSTPWMVVRANWLGNVMTPMVMVNSQVFFSTEKRGLVCTKPRG